MFNGISRNGRFENNLVECEVNHSGFTRVGLSLGGGGSYPDSICEDQNCQAEHTNGQIVNNIIVNCPSDVGIYLNKAPDTQVLHNLLYQTTGIDVRFPNTTAFVDGNVLDGKLRERDDGQATTGTNLVEYRDFDMAYLDPARNDFRPQGIEDLKDQGNPEVHVDFCWNERSETTNLGAIESDCDTSQAHSSPYDGIEGPRPTDGVEGSDPTNASDDGRSSVPTTGCMTLGSAYFASTFLVLPALALRRRQSVLGLATPAVSPGDAVNIEPSAVSTKRRLR